MLRPFLLLALFLTLIGITDSGEAERLFAEGYAKAVRAKTQEEKLEAGDLLLKVVQLDPAHKGAYFYLSVILCEVGGVSRKLMELTIQVVRQTVEFEDFRHLTDLYSCAANLLVTLDRGEDAFEMALRGAKVGPNQANGWLSLARIKVALGDPDEALKYANRCLKLEPFNEIGWNIKAGIYKFTGNEPELRQLYEQAERTDLSDESRAQLYFVLGKAYHDAGNTDKSMDMYIKANRRRRVQFEWSIASFQNELRRHRETFTKQWLLPQLKSSKVQVDASPIFIVGLPRSGSTLIEQILSSHSTVLGAGENTAWAPLVNLFDQTYRSQLNGISYPESMKFLGRGALEDFGNFYAREMREQLNITTGRPGVRWTDKMLRNFVHIGTILLAVPGAKVIATMRHPIDNGLSIFRTVFQKVDGIPYSYDLVEIAEYYNAYKSFMDYWTSFVPSDRLKIVRYEDVVENFESSAREIVEFCGLPWEESILNFHETKRHVHTASAQQVREPIYRTSMGAWKPFGKYVAEMAEVLGENLSEEDRNYISQIKLEL